jgi:hypothetical protein
MNKENQKFWIADSIELINFNHKMNFACPTWRWQLRVHSSKYGLSKVYLPTANIGYGPMEGQDPFKWIVIWVNQFGYPLDETKWWLEGPWTIKIKN